MINLIIIGYFLSYCYQNFKSILYLHFVRISSKILHRSMMGIDNANFTLSIILIICYILSLINLLFIFKIHSKEIY